MKERGSKMEKNYILGLDIGISSVGWGLLELDTNNNPYKIIDVGSRIFTPGEVEKTGDSRAKERREKRILPEKYPPKYTKEKATAEAGAAHSGNLRSNYFWHDVMPGTEDVEKPVYRKEPVYATKYYYEIDKWTVVDTAKSSGNDQNPSWPEPKLKDGQRTGAEEEHYFVTATYEKKKGKTETGRYEMDFSQWKELKKGEKIELKIDAAGFAEINQK